MKQGRPSRALLILAAATACSAWPLAFLLWFRFGEKAFGVSAFLLGLSLGPCLAAYAFVPVKRKQRIRKAVLITGGVSILVLPLFGGVNLDLEGFFILLFLGTGGAAIGHTMVTVIVGPLLFGRFLCGWGCWRAMILELLPIGRSPGRRGGIWNLLPYAGLAASIGFAAVSVSVPLTAGAALIGVYYVCSIGLAFALKDKRAFCKYLCPSSVILRCTSRFSILKMTPVAGLCNGCGACSRVCPMDIDVAAFATQNRRVESGQCILCQRCAQVCPTGALRYLTNFRSAA